MKLKIYGYKKCSSCRKAEKFLEENSLSYESIDITESAPKISELKSMLKQYDGNIKKLFNTSGVIYREMALSSKIADMSTDECLSLLSKNGKLVKRPFLVKDGKGLVVGFKEDLWKGFGLT